MGRLFDELKRRHVFRVAVGYLVAAWVVLQIADIVAPALGLPEWSMTLVVYLFMFGFPVALFLAWAYDLTPEGIQKTPDEDDGQTPIRGNPVFWTFGILALAAIFAVEYMDFGLLQGDQPIVRQEAGGIDLTAPVPGFSGRAAVAVLPFVNMSDDAEQQYFADGLTEDIITDLQTYRGFPVIARTSTFAYKDVNMDVRQIARELGVGYVVEGSVRKTGERLRITAQLVDAGGRHIWADNFDVSLTALISVEDEITGQIVNAIEPELLSAEARRVKYVRTEDLEAFDYYLRALAETTYLFGYTDLHGRPVTRERNDLARELALKAIEIDPQFARAYTLLTHAEAELAHLFRAEVTAEEAEAAIERSIRYGTIARQISPFDSTACSCLAFVLVTKGEVEQALDIQRVAIEANPSHSNARAVYAWALLFDGQHEAALDEIELAKRLSPRDMGMTQYLAIEAAIHLGLGDLEMAATRAREATSMSPLNYDARILQVLALDALGRTEEARTVLGALLADKPDFTVEGLWNTPVADALLDEAAADKNANQRPGYHDFVAGRLARLGWNGPVT